MKKVIFIEFISPSYPHKGAKHHFVGASTEAIMKDTADGTKFGFATFSSHKEITEEVARSLNLEFLDEGITAIKNGPTVSFKLGTPR